MAPRKKTEATSGTAEADDKKKDYAKKKAEDSITIIASDKDSSGKTLKSRLETYAAQHNVKVSKVVRDAAELFLLLAERNTAGLVQQAFMGKEVDKDVLDLAFKRLSKEK